jgi:chemotaxis protein MotB
MAGHGGGAWKVALADFMTALMAFFLVMWILAQKPDLREGTAKYFRDPPKIKMPWTTGVLKNEAKEATVRDINPKRTVDSSAMNSAAAEQKRLNAIAMGFYGMINVKSDDPNRPVDVIVSSEGVLITLYDRPQKPLFRDQTSADLTPWGTFVFQNLAWLADRHSFRVSIEGHTRRGLKMLSAVYSSWELSSDRANNVRRLMSSVAVAGDQFERVVAFGDSRPARSSAAGSENDHRVEVKLSMNQQGMDKAGNKVVTEKSAP